MFEDNDNDVESGLEQRYTTVLDLLEGGLLFPGYREMQTGDPSLKQRLQRAVKCLLLPDPVSRRLTTFLHTWNGVLSDLVYELERAVVLIQQSREDYRQLLSIVIR